jgi:hypothetical protein
MEIASDKSVRLPVFEGAHKDFQVWWTRFQAYATVHKFAAALKDGGEATLPKKEEDAIDETKDEGKLQAAAKKRNEVAMANLAMAFTTDGLMNLVYKAMTEDWPSGKAHLVVEALFKKYKPQDTVTRVEVRQMLNRVSMKRNDDPAVLFESLSKIENKYNTATRKLDEEDLIAVVLDKAPREYQAVLTSEQRFKGDKLTLADLNSAMNQHWRQIKGSGTSEDDGTEVTLSAFGGYCYKCKAKGHKASDCPVKGGDNNINNNGNGKGGGKGKQKFKGKCNNCGKVGHREVDCWLKEANKDKRPKGFKVPGETTTVATDGGSKVEYLLVGMTFPDNHDFLSDPNVWIADTGATVHNTPHQCGLMNVRKAIRWAMVIAKKQFELTTSTEQFAIRTE